MSKSNSLENAYLLLLYNASAYANVADNAASSPLTTLYVAAHTADPGEGGTQTSNECAYTSYARVAIVRTSSGWTVTADTVVPVTNPVPLPQATGGSETITHFSIGELASGAGRLFHIGTVTPNIAVSTGITPKINITIIED